MIRFGFLLMKFSSLGGGEGAPQNTGALREKMGDCFDFVCNVFRKYYYMNGLKAPGIIMLHFGFITFRSYYVGDRNLTFS